jgi:hypothetical protein
MAVLLKGGQKMTLEEAFRQMSQRFISSLRAQAPPGALRLTPNPELQA